MMPMRVLVLMRLALYLLVGCAGGAVIAAEAPGADSQKPAADAEYFALVGDEVVPVEEFVANVQAGVRERFFHGRIPEREFLEFRREMADQLVERVLLLQEAKRRGIKPNPDEVAARLAKIEQRYESNQHWQENRESLLDGVKEKLGNDDLLRQLEAQVKGAPDPAEVEVKAYYEEHPDLFTTPEKDHVLLILLKVDPAAPSEAWLAAEEEGAWIVKKLREGADFGELARIHSGDDSAQNGGDMGYLHKGMLGQMAQQVLELLKPGDISEPALLLEGVAIFKLVDRQAPVLNPFDTVAERARNLLLRERRDETWAALIAKLRQTTRIVVNEELLK